MNKPRNEMIIKSQGDLVRNEQTALAQVLQELPFVPRLLFGLLVSAIVANYLPIIIMAMCGVWVNILDMWIPNAIAVTVLMSFNLIANKIGKIMLFGVALAVLGDLYWLSLVLRTLAVNNLHNCWPNFFYITVGCLLNGFLFLKYKQATHL